MMTKTFKLFLAIGIVTLLGAGCSNNDATNKNSNTPAIGTSRAYPASEKMTVKILEDGSFEPTTVFVKNNTAVTFVNTSSKPHRVASDPHPEHSALPGFDSQTDIESGSSYTYTFDQVGRWFFHDHLNPAFGGAVEVSE